MSARFIGCICIFWDGMEGNLGSWMFFFIAWDLGLKEKGLVIFSGGYYDVWFIVCGLQLTGVIRDPKNSILLS